MIDAELIKTNPQQVASLYNVVVLPTFYTSPGAFHDRFIEQNRGRYIGYKIVSYAAGVPNTHFLVEAYLNAEYTVEDSKAYFLVNKLRYYKHLTEFGLVIDETIDDECDLE